MEHNSRNTKKRVFDAIAAAAAIALLYVVFSLTGVGCPIKYVTGVSCPGCGMTRAWKSLLRLDFAKAAQYHPLWFLPIPGALLFIFRNRIPKKLYRASIFVIVIAFFAVYAFRMADADNTVVVFHPKEGLIGRLIGRLFG